jgi:hypothetical protein
VAARRDVFIGLLTGNYTDAAREALHFDLWRYFACGVRRRCERSQRARRSRSPAFANAAFPTWIRAMLVVGDTPRCRMRGRSGATSIAVATASSRRAGCDEG